MKTKNNFLNAMILNKAVAVIFEHNNTFLAVTRPGNTGMYGFPGGKVELDESTCEAILREISEELGGYGSFSSVHPIFVDLCDGETPYWVTTYAWTDAIPKDYDIETEPGIYFDWLTREELCSHYMSPFWEYNIKAFEAYDKFKEYSC